MVIKVYNQGYEVFIYLLMVLFSKQLLEKDILCFEMSSEEIECIICEVYGKVFYVVGLNNYMGSVMIFNLFGMQKVMQVLECYNFYFFDSVIIGNIQVMCVVQGIGVKVIKCKVFFDDMQNEVDICNQFNCVIVLVWCNGLVIVIGYLYLMMVWVLQQMVYNLLLDIMLVCLSSLLNELQVDNLMLNYVQLFV